MTKRFYPQALFSLLKLSSCLFLYLFLNNCSIPLAQAADFDPETLACSSRLFGTMSKKDCEFTCNKGTAKLCTQVKSYSGAAANGEDLDCYACAQEQYCSDLGYMDIWGCWACDANPKTECILAGVPPGPLGLGSGIGGKTWSGEQCYDCVNKPDLCKTVWPTATWLDTCKANCKGKDEECVFKGISGGNDCYECLKKKKEICKNIGLLSAADCAACNANPATMCAAWGFTKEFEQCFKCVNKPNPPPPPPPPTCEERGLFSKCDPCISKGQGCQWANLGDNLTCAYCVPKAAPQCDPPNLNTWDCAECIKKGGQCIPKTKVRGDPDCYTCYIPPKPKEGCAKYSMPSSCTPNPCSSDEACVMTPIAGEEFQCASCEIKETVDETTLCPEYGYAAHCGVCYQAQQACKAVFVREQGIWCAHCYLPEKATCDGAGMMYGACGREDCRYGLECYEQVLQGVKCHGCECPHGSRKGNCPGDCSGDEICHDLSGDCYTCEDKPIVTPACPQETTPGPCDLASCSVSEKCLSVGERCHACVPKDCNDYGRLRDCTQCDLGSTPKDCVDVSPAPGLTCKECKERSKVTEEQCQDGTIPGACGPSACSSGDKCLPVGEKCHTCVPKNCNDFGLPTDCTTCDLEKTECIDLTPAPGLTCQGCKEKSRVTPQCPENFYPGVCGMGSCPAEMSCTSQDNCHQCRQLPCPQGQGTGACPGNCNVETQNCVMGMPGCYICQEKPKTAKLKSCEDMGMSDGETCSQTCISGGGKCVQRGQDDYGQWCWECIKQSEIGTCKEYGAFDSCYPYNPCPEGQACDYYDAPSGERCARCISTSTVQCEQGWSPGNCNSSGVSCPEGQSCFIKEGPCYQCKVYTDEDRMCPQGQRVGSCGNPYACSPGSEECVQNSDICYSCKEKTRTTTGCPEGSIYGWCESNSCPSDQQCIPDMWHQFCSKCVPKQTYGQPDCPQGSVPGDCPLGCSEGQECIPAGFSCHSCQEKKKQCADYETLPNCTPCQWQGKECAPVNPAPGLACYECKTKTSACGDYYTAEECHRECEYYEGYCQPVNGLAGVIGTQERRKHTCYRCLDYELCSDYGLKSSCYQCPRGSVCQPVLIDQGYGEYLRCATCLSKAEFVYFFYAATSPIGRYILGPAPFNPLELGKLNASSVMGMLKVDSSKAQQMQDILSKMQGASKGKGLAFGSLKDIASSLQKTFSDKKTKFDGNCFDKDFQTSELPKTPPSSGGSAKDKKAQAPAASVGEDENEAIVPNAPLVTCGKVDGQEALTVFDASGAPIKTIFKDEMQKDPNSIFAALTKADEASQNLLRLKEKGWKGLVKDIGSTLVDKIMGPREPEKDKKAKPMQLDPNDPLYFATYGKKVSKVAERMKKVAANPLSSGMRMGGGELGGGGTDSYQEMKDKDPGIEDQWGIRKVGYLPKSDATSAWNVIDGRAQNVVVAVIDSGLDMGHPDGPQYIWTNKGEIPNNGIDDEKDGYIDDVYGWNFLEENNDLTDYKGHGTFVAGIIAARSNNSIGIAGIDPGAVIMPLRVANENGETTDFHIYRAINFAVNHGARVINISLGARGVSKLEQAAINYARDMGVFVSIASGNIGENIGEQGPSSSPGAMSVGSMDLDGKRSTISNWGPNNGLIAPGEQIYSLRSLASFKKGRDSSETKEYYKMDGTSFSSPMVAGTAALLLAKNPNLTPAQIEDILQASATDMYDLGWDGESGAGLLNAAGALRMDPTNLLTVKITKIRANFDDKKNIATVDVFGTVRGEFDNYVVELGKGRHAGSFKQVAGPFQSPATHGWVAQILESEFRGSKEWIVQIRVKDKVGKEKIAQALFLLK